MRAAGGDPERLTKVEPGEAIAHYFPTALPNGRGVLFEAFRGASSRVAVASLSDGAVRYLTPSGSGPRYAPTGHIVFHDQGVLRALGFDASQLTVTSDTPVPLVDGVGPGFDGSGMFDVANNGSLIYMPSIQRAQSALVWVGRDGREESLDLPPHNYGTLRVSPDGTRFAADIREGPRRSEIWVSDLKRPGLSRIPTPQQAGGDWFPKWTPDSRRIVFASYGAKAPGLLWTGADGTGTIEPLLTIDDNAFIDPRGWLADGQSLLFTFGTPAQPRVGLLSMPASVNTKRSWKPLIDRAGGVLAGPLSRDGEWIVTEVGATTRASTSSGFPASAIGSESRPRAEVSTRSGPLMDASCFTGASRMVP